MILVARQKSQAEVGVVDLGDRLCSFKLLPPLVQTQVRAFTGLPGEHRPFSYLALALRVLIGVP